MPKSKISEKMLMEMIKEVMRSCPASVYRSHSKKVIAVILDMNLSTDEIDWDKLAERPPI